MLTTAPRWWRLAGFLGLATALIASLLLTFVNPAAADANCPHYDENGNFIGYGNCDNEEEEDPGTEDPPDGGGEPTCEQPDVVTDQYGEYEWCEGEFWCQASESATDPDSGPPPSPDHIWAFITCLPPGWTGPGDPRAYTETRWLDLGEIQGPTLVERAVSAYRVLRAPAFTLDFNPDIVSYVGTDTAFWVDGPTDDSFQGPPALGLVAEAFNGRVMVDPGDGSGTLECGWAVDQASAQAADCLRTYLESSVDAGNVDSSGRPAYTASAWLVFDVRFLLGGNPIDVPGLGAEFLTWETDPPQTTAVPVGEVQVIID